jgi:3'(2'), 5'-bisphosphate nucleotidase
VVYAPALNVCYYAAPNLGAFVRRDSSEPQAIKVNYPDIGETLKVVASRSHRDARTETLLANLDRYECISMGSSLKLCLVAEGAAHFYPRLAPTMEWDTAAAHAVVNEAGGVVCDLSLNVLRYNKEDMHNPEFLVLPENSLNIENTLLRQMKPSLS